MIDHVSLPVADFARSREFYRAALAPLDINLIMDGPFGAGFAQDRGPFFWVKQAAPETLLNAWAPTPSAGCAGPQLHVAFRATSREAVRQFHAAALAAGGTDNGGPMEHPEYHQDYFGAFVIDPDGHNIEAVCHRTG